MEKKNTILLTVIAVATLLVAVVGATFAYFTAQGGTTRTREIQIQTSTSDSTTFGVSEQTISLTADQDTFASGKGDRAAFTYASVDYTPASSNPSGLCYVLKLTVNTPDINWGAQNEGVWAASESKGSASPEVTLKVYKQTSGETLQATYGTPATAGANQPLEVTGGTLIGSELDITNMTNTVYYVGTSSLESSEANAQHTFTPVEGSTATMSDKYAVVVTLKNLDHDQNYNTGITAASANGVTVEIGRCTPAVPEP